ncbi:hypothetical protein [Streptomyces pseudovenezuelae]|uniref:Uncharacterized protein n=1 Tax=Streptomyces pseudovenezuelae TaxID=67350 RepID=A0ABT6LSI9_9ACTN|nr:hypothetical protein [Streptomyces pseudovenezuelae]MDH6219241.1 hypothetical protein [Streptomyces pseudovenezuelae]
MPLGAAVVRCTGVGAEPEGADGCCTGGEVRGGTGELASAVARGGCAGAAVGVGPGLVVRPTSDGEDDPVAVRRWTTGGVSVGPEAEGTTPGASSIRGASTGVEPLSPGARCTTTSATSPTERAVGAEPVERPARSLSAEGAADPPVSAVPPPVPPAAAFAPDAAGPAEARGATGNVRRCTAAAPVRALVRDCGGRDGEAAGMFLTRRPDAGGGITGAALGPAGTARVGAATAEGPTAATR